MQYLLPFVLMYKCVWNAFVVKVWCHGDSSVGRTDFGAYWNTKHDVRFFFFNILTALVVSTE